MSKPGHCIARGREGAQRNEASAPSCWYRLHGGHGASGKVGGGPGSPRADKYLVETMGWSPREQLRCELSF